MTTPCITLKLSDTQTLTVNAYTWKTDRHNRMRFDVWEGDAILISNSDKHGIVGYLLSEILDRLDEMEPNV